MKSITFLLISAILLFAQIIPIENRINWNPGIPDGAVTEPSTMVNMVQDYGADNSGATNTLAAITQAISDVSSSGGILYFPAGTYRIEGTLNINTSNITLRGAGLDSTKLHFYNPNKVSCIEIVTYGRGDWQSVSGYTKGSTTLSVADGSKFTVGDFAEIQQENDPDFMYTDPKWNVSYAQDLVGQLMEVEAISGNQITLKTPLHITYQSKFNPVIRPQRLIKNVVVEDLYIELKTNTDVATIYYKNAAYGRVQNVESYHTKKAHVSSESAISCEVRDSYFHRAYDYGGGGHGYGVALGYHTTNWLIENNIFDSTRHAMILSKGANGNVFGYNYSQNAVQGDGEENLNEGWNPPDISSHGHYPYMNLFEGNSVNHIAVSDYWGPPGPGNTYFRNRVVTDEMPDGISSADSTIHQNILGNSANTIDDRHYYGPFIDNLIHGNIIGGTLQWSDTVSERTLINSYYLTAKPAFFEDLPWPLYGPAVGFSEKLPAQYRFEGDDIPTPVAPGVKKATTTVQLSVSHNQIQFTNNAQFKQVQIFSVNGREVLRQNIGGRKSISLSTSTLSKGTYLLKLSGVTSVTKKIMVQ